mmetsp:Transcript_64956/g.174189  ORF Transcript_64956/g.174189 Transcript_64956/m.174189 type:complete len:132 (+) Transcript_64956:1130-1525(+)
MVGSSPHWCGAGGLGFAALLGCLPLGGGMSVLHRHLQPGVVTKLLWGVSALLSVGLPSLRMLFWLRCSAAARRCRPLRACVLVLSGSLPLRVVFSAGGLVLPTVAAGVAQFHVSSPASETPGAAPCGSAEW